MSDTETAAISRNVVKIIDTGHGGALSMIAAMLSLISGNSYDVEHIRATLELTDDMNTETVAVETAFSWPSKVALVEWPHGSRTLYLFGAPETQTEGEPLADCALADQTGPVVAGADVGAAPEYDPNDEAAHDALLEKTYAGQGSADRSEAAMEGASDAAQRDATVGSADQIDGDAADEGEGEGEDGDEDQRENEHQRAD